MGSRLRKVLHLGYIIYLWLISSIRIYYQYSPDRLSACPLTIHALLYIVDSITEIGPIWTHWAFPMERYCGHLQCKIKSQCFPWASLDSYVMASAQLEHIHISRNLEDTLRLGPPSAGLPSGSLTSPDHCMSHSLPVCANLITMSDRSAPRSFTPSSLSKHRR